MRVFSRLTNVTTPKEMDTNIYNVLSFLDLDYIKDYSTMYLIYIDNSKDEYISILNVVLDYMYCLIYAN